MQVIAQELVDPSDARPVAAQAGKSEGEPKALHCLGKGGGRFTGDTGEGGEVGVALMPPLELPDAMEAALQSEQQLGEDQDITEVLLSLASGLGKYDRESQLQIMERTKGCLETLLHTAEQECSVRSKTYKVLGICAGVSVAILLL